MSRRMILLHEELALIMKWLDKSIDFIKKQLQKKEANNV